MPSRLILGSAVLGTVLVLACAHAGFVPQPTPMDVERIQPVDPGLTLGEMQAGRAAYVQRCSSCHPVHGPGEYRGDQWGPLIARMQREKKLRIPEHDRVVMERYLRNAFRKLEELHRWLLLSGDAREAGEGIAGRPPCSSCSSR